MTCTSNGVLGDLYTPCEISGSHDGKYRRRRSLLGYSSSVHGAISEKALIFILFLFCLFLRVRINVSVFTTCSQFIGPKEIRTN
jgi:hypothetical protein